MSIINCFFSRPDHIDCKAVAYNIQIVLHHLKADQDFFFWELPCGPHDLVSPVSLAKWASPQFESICADFHHSILADELTGPGSMDQRLASKKSFNLMVCWFDCVFWWSYYNS